MTRIALTAALLTVLLTSAAQAGQFDTSKLTVQNKNSLVVVISEHKALCDVEQSPIIKSLSKQVLSEIDIQSTSMDEVRRATANALDRSGKAAWCAETNAQLKKLTDKIEGKSEASTTPKPTTATSEQLIAAIESEQQAAYWRAVRADGNSLLAQSVSDQSNAQLCAMAAPLASLTEWTGRVKSVQLYQGTLILTLDIGDNYRVEYYALNNTPELLPVLSSVSPGTTIQFTAQIEDACRPFTGGPHYSSRIYLEKGHLSFKTISNIRPGRS